ncbi:MAG: GreA/GreB family elongation factor [Nitrospirae bacterium]|nr:GreA/GreB family elongation factor [Nitrospirota bacterium]
MIEEEVERRFKNYIEAESFLEKWEKESFPFFVKNLENVQGDERDVIFISSTFGRNPQGVVRQNFGPINQETGWRRLNVLFTRARRRMELFTTMQPDDIVVDEKSPRGVKALKDYLLYVKQGLLEPPECTDREPDSEFEIAVADLLRNHNYKVVPQLGVANFFIDIAVRNPFNRGEFLAAIECDGATYHSARSVRERDRLRQQILEGLGWKGKIYRIWSTDWFKDPRNQIKRLLDFLDQLKQKAQTKFAAQPVSAPQSIIPSAEIEDVIPSRILCVEVGDHITYCHVETPDDRKSIQIVRGHGDLNLGTIGENTPLAQALLGSEAGNEVELNVPGRPKRMLRIIDIER